MYLYKCKYKHDYVTLECRASDEIRENIYIHNQCPVEALLLSQISFYIIHRRESIQIGIPQLDEKRPPLYTLHF